MVMTTNSKPVLATQAMIKAFDRTSVDTSDVPDGALVWRTHKGQAYLGRAIVQRPALGRRSRWPSIRLEVIATSGTWRRRRFLAPGNFETTEAMRVRIDTDNEHGRKVFFKPVAESNGFEPTPLPAAVARHVTFRKLEKLGDSLAKLTLRCWHIEHDPTEPVFLLTGSGSADDVTRPGSTMTLAGKVYLRGEAHSKAKRTPPKVEVGQIYTYSWGYNQTNVNAFEVVRMSASGWTATVRPIATRQVDASHVEPVAGAYLERDGEPQRVRLSDDGSFKRSCGRAYVWNGQPKYETPYGQGH